MRRPDRLGVACHLAALLWIGAALARWAAPPAPPDGAPPQLAEREPLARLRPRPEPAVPAEPAPRAPAPPPVPVAAPRAVSAADLAAGEVLLDGEGRFTVLSCSYRDFPSFREYARAMVELGARFVAVRQRRIVGTVDLEAGRWSDGAPAASFSPRARDYAGEPELQPVSRAARERYGAGASVMMLVPRSLDAGLFGGIDRALAERAHAARDLREIRGRYEPGASGVRLRVEAAVRRDGSTLPVDLVFDLAPLARGAGSPPTGSGA